MKYHFQTCLVVDILNYFTLIHSKIFIHVFIYVFIVHERQDISTAVQKYWNEMNIIIGEMNEHYNVSHNALNNIIL